MNRPPGLMKSEASVVPVEAAVRNHTPRLTCQISDDILVPNVEDAPGGQDPPPVIHHALVMPVIAPEFGQIIGLMLAVREQL